MVQKPREGQISNFCMTLVSGVSFIVSQSSRKLLSDPVVDMAKEIPYEALNTLHVSHFHSQSRIVLHIVNTASIE